MYHCLITPKEVYLTGRQVPPMTSLNVFESMQRSQVDKDDESINEDGAMKETET